MAAPLPRPRSNRPRLRNALFSASVAATALVSHVPKACADYATGVGATYSNSFSPNEDRAMKFVILKLEGSGYNPDDDGYGPSRWGILGSANDLTDQQVYDLTFSNAEQIYDQRYWHAVNNIDQMPFPMQVVAFNAAVNISPNAANKMVADAHGDPRVVMRETQDWYNGLDETNPALYGPDMPGWAWRQRKIATFIDDNLPTATPANDDALAQAEPHSFLPEANAATMAQPLAPDATDAVTKNVSPATEEMEGLAGGTIGDILWAFLLAPIIALWKRWFRPRRPASHNYRPDETPLRVALDGAKSETAARDNALRAAKGYASGEQKSDGQIPPFNRDHLDGFSEPERDAFIKLFAHRVAAPALQSQKQWHIDYGEASRVVVERQRVTLYGEKGIEDTLLYASHAWGGCKVTEASADYLRKMESVAQRLVDERKLPSGFLIEGIGVITRTPAAAAPARPRRPFPANGYKPMDMRSFNPMAAMPG